MYNFYHKIYPLKRQKPASNYHFLKQTVKGGVVSVNV